MSPESQAQKALGIALQAIFFIFAVWLLSPFFRIDASDYANGRENAYRLFLGLLILIIYLGKYAFDALAPQGLAHHVSGLKAAALIAFGVILLGFIVYTVAQATVLFLQAGASQDTGSDLF